MAQNELKTQQLQSVLQYINEKSVCKNKVLLKYFGETIEDDCGICSFCITKTKTKKNTSSLSAKIIELLTIQDLNSRDIQKLTKFPKDEVIFALQQLLENNRVILKPNNLYSLKK